MCFKNTKIISVIYCIQPNTVSFQHVANMKIIEVFYLSFHIAIFEIQCAYYT